MAPPVVSVPAPPETVEVGATNPSCVAKAFKPVAVVSSDAAVLAISVASDGARIADPAGKTLCRFAKAAATSCAAFKSGPVS